MFVRLSADTAGNRCYHHAMWQSVPLTFFWFVYFGSLGIFYPYFTLYLRENAGLTGTEVGLILAISPLVGMIAQPLWGQLADRTGARSRTLAFLTFGTALGYLGVGLADGFWFIVLAMAGLAFVGTAIFPIMTSVSLAILRNAGGYAFGYVRAWGTAGYFVLILIFPWLLQILPTPKDGGLASSASQPGLGLMFPITATLVLTAAGIAFFLPKKGVVAVRAARGDWRELIDNPAFLRFLLFSLFANFLMHGPMWLFPLFVRSRGGDLGTIRNMWILMLLIEIPLVLSTGRGLKRLGARGLLAVGVLLGGVRWTLSALISDPTWLFAVQALHGLTVVGLNIGSPLYLDIVAPEKLRSTAQGVLSMVATGIAGIASNISAGLLIDRSGIDLLYLFCGFGSLVLGALAPCILVGVQHPAQMIREAGLPSDTPA
jgi:MFS transporter, PPP family, 3-phenylpropionic acid transporter